MAGVNSLGIGSGVLTSDLVDKLRAADEATVLKPLEDRIALDVQKEDANALLGSLMTTFKGSASALDGDNLYLSRAVTGNTDAVTVKAEAGSNVQAFSITNIDMAEADVWDSAALSTKSTPIVDLGTGTLTINVGGEDFDIEYTENSSLNDIRDSINEVAGDKMTASVLQVGTDSYELVLTAKETNQPITFSDSNSPVAQVDTVTLADATLEDGDEFSLTINGFTASYVADVTNGDDLDAVNNALKAMMDAHDFGSGAGNDFTISTSEDGTQTITAINAATPFTSSAAVVNDASASASMSSDQTTETIVGDSAASLATALSLNNIQQAKAATFNYNGIKITRDTNEISDLITGVTISLEQNQTAEERASINIAQNNTSISSEMSMFVSSYNSLITNLQDMTRSDRESGSVGIFNGDSFVRGIGRELTSLLTQVDSNGESLMDYGIEIDQYGVMSLDTEVFNAKLSNDPEGMELFFSGNSETDGIFTKLDAKMTEYTGYDKLLSNFTDQLDSLKESNITQYDKQKASLDSRYEILTQKFIAYDAMISKLNSQFASMQMMIDQSYATSS